MDFPGEDKEMMMQTAKAVADMGADGIKIHLLHIIKILLYGIS